MTSGSSYVVPATGGITSWTVTSWSHNASRGAEQTLTMKVFRKVADPATYVVVGHDGPRNLTESTVNTFPTSIPVKPGDFLGLNAASPVLNACAFATPPGNGYLIRNGSLADGESGDFTTDRQ